LKFIQALETPLGAGNLPRNTRISLTGKVHCLGKSLENHLGNVVSLVAIQEFNV
jgi:hypothetical protein